MENEPAIDINNNGIYIVPESIREDSNIRTRKPRKLDKWLLGLGKADIAIINILNESEDGELQNRILVFLSKMRAFVKSVKFDKVGKLDNVKANADFLYAILKKYYTEKIENLYLGLYPQLRIPLKCSVITYLRGYFLRNKNYKITKPK